MARLTVEQIIRRALARGPVRGLDFGPAYIRAGGHDFTGWAGTDVVVRCRARMVQAGEIVESRDARGEVIYHLARERTWEG